MTIENIHQSIADNMVDNIFINDWANAFITVEYYDESALELEGGYKTKSNDFISFKFRNFDRRIISDFHRLHKITSFDSGKKWNRAAFTLEPTGKFNIDVNWDQELADEIERFSNK
ncbi:hypothetical protein [Flocculibacter collagenilyticus]|uniref:hypothetical protein n=1 Tax=Flocculibacter collagenilyticus TaxID=2744479 RepID=UPI0018F665C5|nr:hypothetical protein [Flocculibacter collagenilyticus]